MSSSVPSIAQWQEQVERRLPSLTKAEANVLGLLSYAMVFTGGCGLTRLSCWLALVEQVPAGRVRQRMREFSYEAKAKRGSKRREVEVEGCFADLLRAIVQGWHGPRRTGVGAGCQYAGRTLYGALNQRGVSGLWDTKSLDHSACE
jgi:hypothetical protein